MDRFQRFQSGSRTAEPGRPDTGSQPIGLEPEPVPVMADIRKPIGSKTGTPAEGGNDMSQPWRPDWLDAVCRKIDAKIAAEQRARRRRRYSLDGHCQVAGRHPKSIPNMLCSRSDEIACLGAEATEFSPT